MHLSLIKTYTGSEIMSKALVSPGINPLDAVTLLRVCNVMSQKQAINVRIKEVGTTRVHKEEIISCNIINTIFWQLSTKPGIK